MDDPVVAIESIDESCTADDRDSRWVEFMLASCELIRPLMSRYALRAFEVARRYWSGDGATKDELTQARVECWKQLDAARSASKPDDPMVYAARAMMGLLYPDKATGDDRVEHLQFVVEIANRAEDHRREQLQLLAAIFPDAAV